MPPHRPAPAPRRPRTGRIAAVLTALTLLGAACAAPATPPRAAQSTTATAPHSRPASPQVRDDLLEVFRQASVTGTFVLMEAESGRTTVVGRERAARRYVPASTFKIPHSLIALETGAVADAEEVIPYGGRPQPRPEWERDMTLREAIAASNVPVFQTLARRIGLARERHWLRRLGYGNRQTGTALDRFWLDGPLAISALEQTGFLARLATGRLPASRRHQRLVRDLLRVERTVDYALFAKTGWGTAGDPGIGWWVGWVERDGRIWTFALNIDVGDDRDAALRIPLGRRLLHRLGVLPYPA